ncbi:MAG: hypothetical protein EON92_12095 [Burkholderiales bacterium]|nr:MAG: hypothetical protein EON92_12095 [Burkholderiales bacterium]
MNTDQVAKMVPAIQEALAGRPDLCATLQIAGKPDSWVQFTDGMVNAAYPFSESPDSLLSQLGGGTLEGWEAQTYLTVQMESADAHAIASWIDRYFQKALAAGAGYAIDVSVEPL